MGNNVSLREASEKGQVRRLVELLRRGVEIDHRGLWGWSALHYGAFYGRSQCISTLIEAGARIDMKDWWGCTPLHLAADKGHVDAVESLINTGSARADVLIQDNSYDLPLHKAARNGHLAVVKLLAPAKNTSLSLLGWDGMTAKEVSRRRYHLEVFKYLEGLEHQDDRGEQDSLGHSLNPSAGARVLMYGTSQNSCKDFRLLDRL